jgi:hypothetical protein
MSTPNRVLVGTLSSVTFDGPGRFVRPFQDRGDTQSFEWHIDCYQLAANFTPFQNSRFYSTGFVSPVENMQYVTTTLGVAYLVHEEQPEYTACKGWLKFKRVYASLPITRQEGTSVVHSFQLYSTQPGYDWTEPPPAPEVAEWPLVCSGYYLYEYFLSYWPEPLRAPKITSLFGLLLMTNQVPPNTGTFVSKDSEISIYKGSIIERKTLYVNTPTIAELS